MSAAQQTVVGTYWPQLITVMTGPALQSSVGSEITLDQERSTLWIASMIATSQNTGTRGTKLLNSNDGIVTAEQAWTAAIEHPAAHNPWTGVPSSMAPDTIEWGKIIQHSYKKHWDKDITSTSGELFQLIRDGASVFTGAKGLDGVIEAAKSCDGSVYTLTEYDRSGRPLRVTALLKRFMEFQDLQGLQPEDG